MLSSEDSTSQSSLDNTIPNYYLLKIAYSHFWRGRLSVDGRQHITMLWRWQIIIYWKYKYLLNVLSFILFLLQQFCFVFAWHLTLLMMISNQKHSSRIIFETHYTSISYFQQPALAPFSFWLKTSSVQERNMDYQLCHI